MSSALFIDGKKYILARDAKKYFSYTKDYLLLLAKEGKVEGKKIGAKWYLNVESIENFFAHVEQTKKERSELLRHTRKLELKTRNVAMVQSPISHNRVVRNSAALLHTFAIACVGIAMGTLGYVGVTSPQIHNQSVTARLEYLARQTYTSLQGDTSSAQVFGGVGALSSTQSFATTVPTLAQGLVIIPDAASMTVSEIQSSFSDPVSVAFDEPNGQTGVVTPAFTDDNTSYRFILVPKISDTTSPL